MSALLLAAIGQTLGPPSVLSAADRVPAAIVVLTPFGTGSAAGTSRYVAAMARVLHRRTDLRALSSEQTGLDLGALTRCPARRQLTCWSRVVAAVRQDGRRPPLYLFSLAVRRLDEGRDRLSISMLDTSLADRRSETGDALEDQLFRRTPRTHPETINVVDPGTLAEAIDELVRESFAEPLAEEGHWAPFGSLAFRSPCEACEVFVDGRLVGLSRRGPTRIEGLRSGTHRIRLRQGRATVLQCEVETSAGRTRTPPSGACTVADADRPDRGALWLRYAGLAAALAGGALVAYGLVEASNAPTSVCVVPSGRSADRCRRLGAPGFGFDENARVTNDAGDVNPSGVPIVAVGAGLVGLGATMSAGSWLWNDWPWWGQALLATAVGGAALGVGIAAGGGS